MNLTENVGLRNVNATPTISLIACLISSVGYGINYLPVKKFETGDGMFFQWIVSNAIFIGCFISNSYYKFPTFHPLVMLGGFLWSTGNICVVPIIKTIGLGLGLLIWGSSSLIFGWASGRFGWFGIDCQLPKDYPLNYAGFSLIALSPILYSLVKVSIVPNELDENTEIEVASAESLCLNNDFTVQEIVKRSLEMKSRIIGVILSLISGAMYGFSFVPVMYVKNRYPGASQIDGDYIFAQCSGIYLGSSFYFLLYCIFKGNTPVLYPKVILPAFMSGVIWFISYVGYFVANQDLSPAVTQPIVTALSGAISTSITVIIYREVKGTRNYVIIVIAITVAVTGSVLIGLSKII